MRKLIVFEHISMDGVIQGAGGPDEDTSDGFAYGGWCAPYSDETLEAELMKMMNSPFELLLGVKPLRLGRGSGRKMEISGPVSTRRRSTSARIP